MNTPTLETERLVLRKFSEDDLGALFAILKDEEANRFLPWYPARNLGEARKFFEERFASVYRRPQGYAYAICLKEDDAPVGYVTVDMGSGHDFGYGLRKELWGKGVATEAARAVADRVRADGLPYVTATHDRDNPGSGRVMQKLGMTYRYSYEELWQPKNIPVVFRMYQLNFSAPNGFVYRGYWDMYGNHFIEDL